MQGRHYATLGMLLAAIAMMIAGLDHWSDALHPPFIAGLLATIGTVFKSMGDAPFGEPSKDSVISSVGKIGGGALVLALAIGGTGLALSSCAAAAPPALSPAAKVAFTADQIVKRIDELQNATIAASQLQAIPDSVAVPIVRFCVSAAKILRDTPSGTLPAIAAEWARLKPTIPIAYRQKPEIAAAFVAVDIALAELGAGDQP